MSSNGKKRPEEPQYIHTSYSDDQLIDAPRLAPILGLATATVRQWVVYKPSHLPPAIRLGNRVRWRMGAVRQWLIEQERAAIASAKPRRPGRPRKRA